jgi:hypothetical protein
MANGDEFVIGHAQYATHHFRRADEARRHNAYGGDTLPFSCNSVMQIA